MTTAKSQSQGRGRFCEIASCGSWRASIGTVPLGLLHEIGRSATRLRSNGSLLSLATTSRTALRCSSISEGAAMKMRNSMIMGAPFD